MDNMKGEDYIWHSPEIFHHDRHKPRLKFPIFVFFILQPGQMPTFRGYEHGDAFALFDLLYGKILTGEKRVVSTVQAQHWYADVCNGFRTTSVVQELYWLGSR